MKKTNFKKNLPYIVPICILIFFIIFKLFTLDISFLDMKMCIRDRVYSTCTVNKEENEDIVNKVLSENNDLVLDPINIPFEFEYDKKMAEKGILNVRGDKNNSDSFFIARIKRI